MTPGFFTDAIGFICLLPFSRIWLANRIAKKAKIKTQGAVYKEENSKIYDGEFSIKDNDRLK